MVQLPSIPSLNVSVRPRHVMMLTQTYNSQKITIAVNTMSVSLMLHSSLSSCRGPVAMPGAGVPMGTVVVLVGPVVVFAPVAIAKASRQASLDRRSMPLHSRVDMRVILTKFSHLRVVVVYFPRTKRGEARHISRRPRCATTRPPLPQLTTTTYLLYLLWRPVFLALILTVVIPQVCLCLHREGRPLPSAGSIPCWGGGPSYSFSRVGQLSLLLSLT